MITIDKSQTRMGPLEFLSNEIVASLILILGKVTLGCFFIIDALTPSCFITQEDMVQQNAACSKTAIALLHGLISGLIAGFVPVLIMGPKSGSIIVLIIFLPVLHLLHIYTKRGVQIEAGMDQETDEESDEDIDEGIGED